MPQTVKNKDIQRESAEPPNQRGLWLRGKAGSRSQELGDADGSKHCQSGHKRQHQAWLNIEGRFFRKRVMNEGGMDEI